MEQKSGPQDWWELQRGARGTHYASPVSQSCCESPCYSLQKLKVVSVSQVKGLLERVGSQPTVGEAGLGVHRHTVLLMVMFYV